MIIIAGTIDLVDPESRAACIEGSVRFQQASREEEPGCLAYCFAADPVVAGRIQVYELWQDEQSLAAHFTHANYFGMRDFLSGAGLRGADNRKYRIDRVAPVYDEQFRPTADFSSSDADASGG